MSATALAKDECLHTKRFCFWRVIHLKPLLIGLLLRNYFLKIVKMSGTGNLTVMLPKDIL
jgi:hypothetical protein